MTIPPVSSATSPVAANATAARPAGPSLDYDAFLQLLIAQMKNQDPLSPADATQYIAQLASFSSVEQAIKTNTKLDSLLTSMSLAQGQGLIGRNVTSADGAHSGTVTALHITSAGVVAELGGGARVPLGVGVVIR